MTESPVPPSGDRLAKVIARAGLCSRREAEDWITTGRVSVNGKKVLTPAFNVTDRDKISVDGKPLAARQGTRVWLYHKPAGLVVTEKDPEGRPTIYDALADQGLPRFVTVGRLDINTEGLLLLTNDGGLKRVLELPATGWLRRYRVRAYGSVTQAMLDSLKNGIEVEGIKYGPIEAQLEREQGSNVWITIGLREGKNREVKNVLQSLGLSVNRLIRVSYGPFQLGDLGEGKVEVVKARVLRDQLGNRLAAEAGADFDSELPERRPPIDANKRAAAPGKKVATGGKRPARQTRDFWFEDDEPRPQRDEAERARPGRPGRFAPAPRPARAAPERAREDNAPKRRIHFSDGRESEDYAGPRPTPRPRRFDPDDQPARSFGRRPDERGTERRERRDDGMSTGQRPARPTDGPARRGPPAKRPFGERPPRADGDAPRPARPRPPREGAPAAEKSFGRRPGGAAERKPYAKREDRPAGEDRPARAPRSERPAGKPIGGKPFGGKPGAKPFGARGGRPGGAGSRPGGKPSSRPGGPAKPRRPRGE